MKNNRPIEVGQVRQVIHKGEVSFGNLYHVDNIIEMGGGYTFCEITFIDGILKGDNVDWGIDDVQQDIVVM